MSPPNTPSDDSSSHSRGVWTAKELDRFLQAMRMFPAGPWKDVAAYVGTRSVRQVQTHAQKYNEKVARRGRGLKKKRRRVLRPEHRLDTGSVDTVDRMDHLAKSPLMPTSPHLPPSRLGFERTDRHSEYNSDFEDECLDFLVRVLTSDERALH